MHISPTKVKSINECPRPENVPQLQSFLGMVQYHSRFIRSLSTLLHPLTTLLQKGTPWSWTAMCEQAFHAVKQQLTSATVLTHYNPDLELRMAADASPYGVGAVLTHIMPDGAERPIAYASRTLTQSERNYAQLEREALALIFGVKKFHQFLLGRPFILVTDHKPLLTILGPKKGPGTHHGGSTVATMHGHSPCLPTHTPWSSNTQRRMPRPMLFLACHVQQQRMISSSSQRSHAPSITYKDCR